MSLLFCISFSILIIIFKNIDNHPADHCTINSNVILTCWNYSINYTQYYDDNINSKNITTIELYNMWGINELNLDYFIRKYPLLVNFSIVNGNFSEFIPTSNGKNNKIKYLKLKNVGIQSIGRTFLKNFPNLEILNLENNYIQTLDFYNKNSKEQHHLKQLYLKGNHWNCDTKNLTLLIKLNNLINDYDQLLCYEGEHNGKPLKIVANFIDDIENNCPEICQCTLNKIVQNPESDLWEPIIEVNCSNNNLKNFPDKLPKKTRILHMENNQIDNLQKFFNPQYHDILDLYIDNNKIDNINQLEGSYWLKNFRVLSLKGNYLTELPTYAFDNALDQNPNMPNALRIFLSGNPWRCDCVFTPVFQEMLQKFSPQIKDVLDVKCSYIEGDENSLLPIIELSRSSVCRLPSEYSVQALDLLNFILASLIVFILCKLAYDYYFFKKTGRLPWIVTKMP